MAGDEQLAIVYWLHNDICIRPESCGYIGITVRTLKRRLIEHRKRGNFPRGFQGTILFEGTKEQCLAYEAMLRPRPHIGWNKASGGCHGSRHSEEAKIKIAEANRRKKYRRGYKLTAEHVEKIRAGNLGKKRTDAMKIALSARQKGIPKGKLPEETCRKISEALQGHHVSAATRNKIAIANKGNRSAYARWHPGQMELFDGR
jgi:hypothetical protein